MTKQIESVVKLLVDEMSAITNNFHNTNFNISKKNINNFWVGVFISESHIKQASLLTRRIVWGESKTRLALIRLEPDKNGDHFHYACLPVKRLWVKDLMSPERVDLDNIGVHKQSGRGDYWGNRNKEQVRARPLTAEYQMGPHFKTEQLVAAKLCNRENQNRPFHVNKLFYQKQSHRLVVSFPLIETGNNCRDRERPSNDGGATCTNPRVMSMIFSPNFFLSGHHA